MAGHKPRVGIFDFTGCEGCELNQLNFEDQLLDILAHVDIVEWREAMDDKATSTTSPLSRARFRRRTASRASTTSGARQGAGGARGLRGAGRHQRHEETPAHRRGARRSLRRRQVPVSDPAGPGGHEVVKVDHKVRGCPMTQIEFLKVFTALVMGKEPIEPDHSVCVECKLKENECVYERGMICLGPGHPRGLRRPMPGCGQYCTGCRGLVSEPNLKGWKRSWSSTG